MCSIHDVFKLKDYYYSLSGILYTKYCLLHQSKICSTMKSAYVFRHCMLVSGRSLELVTKSINVGSNCEHLLFSAYCFKATQKEVQRLNTWTAMKFGLFMAGGRENENKILKP